MTKIRISMIGNRRIAGEKWSAYYNGETAECLLILALAKKWLSELALNEVVEEKQKEKAKEEST